MNRDALNAERGELLISIGANAHQLKQVAAIGDIAQIREFGMRLFYEIERLSNVETIIRNMT